MFFMQLRGLRINPLETGKPVTICEEMTDGKIVITEDRKWAAIHYATRLRHEQIFSSGFPLVSSVDPDSYLDAEPYKSRTCPFRTE